MYDFFLFHSFNVSVKELLLLKSFYDLNDKIKVM